MLNLPPEVCLEELREIHRRVITDLSSLFGLDAQNVPEIEVGIVKWADLSRKFNPRGLFDPAPLRMYVSPNRHDTFFEFQETGVHETAHYLHSIVRPEFYDEKFDQMMGSAGVDEKYKYCNFRENVVESSVFEFFRVNGQLVRKLEPSKGLTFIDFCNYAFYKKLYDSNRLIEFVRTPLENFDAITHLNNLFTETRDYFRTHLCDVSQLGYPPQNKKIQQLELL